MTQVVKTVYLFATLNEYDSDGEPLYFTSLNETVPRGYVLVGSAALTHAEPKRGNLVAAKIGQYEHEIKQTRADAELFAREKSEAIQNLLAITHEGTLQ